VDTAYETLIQLLDERDVRYVSIDEEQSVVTDLKGEVASYRVLAKVNTEAEVFQVLGCFPVWVPEGSRSDIAEAVARANFGLEVGKFELDMDDGELRYQISQLLTDGLLEEAVIDRIITVTVTLLDTYVPAVLSVIYGNELPQDAIRHVEAARFGQTDAGDEQEEAARCGQSESDEQAESEQIGQADSDEKERIARQLFESIETSEWTCTHCGHQGVHHKDFRLSIGPESCVICRKCGWPQEQDP